MPDLEQGIPDTRLGNAVVAIRETLADDTVAHLVGEKHLGAHQQARCVVWAIRPSRITRPERTTGGAFASGAEAERTTATRVRLEFVQAYLYAEDSTAVELLLDNLLAAIDNTFGSEAEPDEYEWITQQPGSAGHMNRGELIRLDVTFRWLVLKEISPLAIMTSLEHGC